MGKPRITFNLRLTEDIRTEEARESYRRIWKNWKMRTIPSWWKKNVVQFPKSA